MLGLSLSNFRIRENEALIACRRRNKATAKQKVEGVATDECKKESIISAEFQILFAAALHYKA
jgi:hypothetical protein